jgi:uncharacterized repeat protein (TIGR03803 family)
MSYPYHVKCVTAVLTAFACALLPRTSLATPTFAVLYNFTGLADGDHPQCALIEDAQGNLYGTTAAGGITNVPAAGPRTGSMVGPQYGVLFRLAPDGTETVMHEFGIGKDGANPRAGVITDAKGNMYGTTAFGGPSYAGTVFEMTPAGKETILHKFAGGTDGAVPEASLVRAGSNYYGTTNEGGSFGAGTVFMVGPKHAYSVLFSFTGATTGSFPLGGLVLDSAGNLYGDTYFGGNGDYGTVFMLSPSGTETILYSFKAGKDGKSPAGSLLRDGAGNLYGVTYAGGKTNDGTVFKLSPAGTEHQLHVFAGAPNDGAGPYSALIMDAQGNMYGTTSQGGTSDFGTVFELSPKGAITILHNFSGSDGEAPLAPLLLDAQGNLYGTTSLGGTANSGVVFEISP